MNKKKIIFVIDSLQSGGAEKSLVTLLNLIDYNRYTVDLAMVHPHGLYLPLVPKEINILALKRKSNVFHKLLYSSLLRINNIFKFLHSSQLSWCIFSSDYQEIKNKYDIAIAYTQGFPTYFCDKYIHAEKKICWVNTNYKMAGYNCLYDKKFYKNYKKICIVSQQAREVFIQEHKHFSEKTLVVKDIISEKFILNMVNGLDNPYLYKDTFNILTIGRLVTVKGYDLLIEAAIFLKKNGVNFKWNIIGEGPLEKEIFEKIKEYELEQNVFILGVFQNPYSYIKYCDLYCQPSLMEGFGMAIAEARIFRKPIVVTNFKTSTEQICDGKNGLIVEMNGLSISKAIVRIIKDAKLSQKLTSGHISFSPDTSNEINKIYNIFD